VPSQGQIIWANVYDPQGRNPKDRPLLVVSNTSEIAEEAPFWCVAISHTLPPTLPDHWILLPFSNTGPHPETGLKKKCAAVCDWPVQIRPQDIKSVVGSAPPKHLNKILEKIRELGSIARASKQTQVRDGSESTELS